MVNLISSSLDWIRSSVGNVAWDPLVGLSRKLVISVLDRIEIGQLVIEEGDSTRVYGSQNVVVGSPPSSVSTITIKSNAFWIRVALFADMGFAESYMLGEFDCTDLTAFFRIFIFNRDQLSNGTNWTSAISSKVNGLIKPINDLVGSSLNIAAHYDLSNEMFAAFLSSDMTYSCPIWDTQKGGKLHHESLHDAQLRKLDYIADQARLKSTDRVLEIGTGWGSFAIRAVQRFGCHVTSLTLSQEQKELAEKRIAAAGLSDKIDVQLCDYRLHKAAPYDKIVSIEMLEAVGREYLSTYFTCIDNLLKGDGGIAVFQCITIPEARYEAYSRSQDFINKYIFPGGHLPSAFALFEAVNKGAKGDLIVDAVRNIGPHYAKALRLWKESFLTNFDTKVVADLEKRHEMTSSELDIFKRKWEYYFTYCEAAFNTKTLGDHIITVAREGALSMMEGIPL